MPNSRTQGNPFKLKFLQPGAQLSSDFASPSRPTKWLKMAGNGGEFKIFGPRPFPEVQDRHCPFRPAKWWETAEIGGENKKSGPMLGPEPAASPDPTRPPIWEEMRGNEREILISGPGPPPE